MKIGHEVSSAGDRFIAALASTRLPDVSTRQELGEGTLNDSGIIRMWEDFATSRMTNEDRETAVWSPSQVRDGVAG